MSEKVVLVILDGWGIAQNKEVSAIDKANTPYVDSLYTRFPNSILRTSGLDVGLPDGQMGNSEVGHMNLGAGRVVYQDLVKINLAVKDHSLHTNPVLLEAFQQARKNNKKVHFMGLVSDGGVHSHIDHLKGLCDAAKEQGLQNVFIHAFTDGRDTDPTGGIKYLQDLEGHLQQHSTGRIASIIGRYYAMDRDNRWERVKLAYDLMVKGIGEKSTNIFSSIQNSYEQGVTDEFLKPIVKVDNGEPIATIEAGDVVVCFNFRTDRGREITLALTQMDFPEQDMKKLQLYYITMTRYDDTFSDVKVLFEKDNLHNTLGEILERYGKKQIRIAETEKYPHVTFFFSGGRETEFVGEKRIMCPSPKVATYDLQPEMSAYEIRDKIVEELKKKEADFVCLNFANPDMVGHTGVFEAAVKACEVVDACTRDVAETALNNGYSLLIIADHGNADFMINEDGSVNTAHTTNPVPLFYLSNTYKGELKSGKLGDIAPTILKIMGIPIPEVMTGNVLIS